MKKIAFILSVMVASIALSCVKPFEYSIPLALDNFEVNIPKTVADTTEPIHYIHITSNGNWEATLITENKDAWCWLQDYYVDAYGNYVYHVTPISAFEGLAEMGRWNVVQGSGTLYLPLVYTTAAVNRYAKLIVRNTDTGDVREMRITQK